MTLLLALPAGATAAVKTTTVEDDALPVGTAIAHYPAVEPEINFVAPSGFATGTPEEGVLAPQACPGSPVVKEVSPTSSPPHAERMQSCGNSEYPYHGSFFELTDTANEVSAYVGDPAQSGAPFELDAYNLDRELVAQTSVSASGAGITTPISVSTGASYTIAFVALYEDSGGSDHAATGMDDLKVHSGEGAPSISLSSSVSSTRLAQGAQAHYQVSVVRHNGSNGKVELSASGLPAGVHASFSPQTLTGTNTASQLTLTVDDNAPLEATTASITATPTEKTAGSSPSSVPVSVRVLAPFGVYVGGGQRSAQPSSTSVLLPPCSTVGVPVVTLLGDAFQGSPINLALNSSGAGADVGSISLPMTSLANPGDFNARAENEQTLAITSNAQAEPYAFGFHIEITPTSGNFTEPSAEIAVQKVAPEINSVGPTTVETPQLLKPGSEVTLKGAGFCPNSTVSFGNSKAIATPEYVSADGTEMRVPTPLLATSGPVTVESAGRTGTSAQSLTVNSFRDTYGFSWENKDYGMRLNEQMVEALFGEEAHEEFAGAKWRKPNAVLYEAATNKLIPEGLCFGVAFTSLELRDYPATLSEYPRSGGYGAWYLNGSKEPSEPLLKTVVENHSLQFTDQLLPIEVNSVIGIHRPSDDIRTIESELAGGEPVMIGLIHWNGLSLTAHTVLAYDLRSPSFGTAEIRVYNPDDPYTTGEATNVAEHERGELTKSQIFMDSNGDWEFPGGANLSGSEGKPWRGSEADMVVFPHSKLPIINGELPHLPNILAALGEVAFASAGDRVTQVSDGRGALFSGGQIAPRSVWPAGVAPLADFSGHPSPLQLVGLNPQLARPVTATVERSTGGGAMDLRLPGLQASLQAGVHTRQVDHVTVDGRSDAIGYQTSAAHAALGGTLLSSPAFAARASAHANATSALNDRLVQFQLTSSHGGRDELSFPSGRGFVVHHSGAPTGLSLTLSAFSPSGQPIAVQLPSVQVEAGATVSVVPEDWHALGSAIVRVSSTVHGHTTIQLVRGRLIGRRFASVRDAKLISAGRGPHRVEVVLRLSHTPVQPSLSLAARLLAHGHTLTQGRPVLLSGPALAAGRAQMTLSGPVRPGRYTLELRLLEITANGAIQGSVAVTRRVPVRVR
jgi:hypothetical protein